VLLNNDHSYCICLIKSIYHMSCVHTNIHDVLGLNVTKHGRRLVLLCSQSVTNVRIDLAACSIYKKLAY